MSQPETPIRSMQDRKVLTEDALRLSKHALEKELNKRKEDTFFDLCKIVAENQDKFIRFRDEAVKLAKSIQHSVKASVDESLHYFNDTSVSGYGYDNYFMGRTREEHRLQSEISILEPAVAIQLPGYIDSWDFKIPPSVSDVSRHFSVGSLRTVIEKVEYLAEQIEANDHGAAFDMDAFYYVEVAHIDDDDESYDIEELTRVVKIEVTCSMELEQARIAVAVLKAPLKCAEDAYDKACSDLENLDSTLEQLELQAVAQRVKDAGGADLLKGVTESVKTILAGGSLSTPLLDDPEDV